MRFYALLAAAATLPAAAFAHPGSHEGYDGAGAALHVVAAPDHLGLLVVAGLLLAGCGASLAFIRPRNRKQD